jgi:hypothetical protein
MIRARLTNGDFIFGVDAENIRRLTMGQPIIMNLRLMGGTDKLLLVYGETLDDIKRDLERVTAAPLPPAQPLPSDEEPRQ